MWAAAPGLAASRCKVLGKKAKPFHGLSNGVRLGGCPNMSLHVSIRERIFVQERLLEMSGSIRAFHLDLVVHKLESLIMAQNERWRHA